MTHVVCDSGPLTHLWQIGLWSTLRTFETLYVAQQVIEEIREHVPLNRLESLPDCELHIHTISQHEIDVQRQRAPSDLKLQIADLATLALAQRVTPDLVLTDDLDLRRAIESQGQLPMGSVGIVLRAYKAGWLDEVSLDQAIDGLFVHSTLYLSPSFKSYVRRLIIQMMGRNTQGKSPKK